ncbi:MAG: hypothetical protein N3E44_02710 [Candidatus Bathyarchaeota archaeon]|nr:hypothetical protein [Candidatus Bathyarchaeota archaeon]
MRILELTISIRKYLVIEKNTLVRNAYARRIYLEDDCRVTGETLYTEELKIGSNVYFAVYPWKVDYLAATPI